MAASIPRSRRMLRLLGAVAGASLDQLSTTQNFDPDRSQSGVVSVDELRVSFPGIYAVMMMDKAPRSPVDPVPWASVIVKGRRSRSEGIERSETLDEGE